MSLRCIFVVTVFMSIVVIFTVFYKFYVIQGQGNKEIALEQENIEKEEDASESESLKMSNKEEEIDWIIPIIIVVSAIIVFGGLIHLASLRNDTLF